GWELRKLARSEMEPEWDPRTVQRVTDWECAQHLIHALSQYGEDGAARLARRMGGEKAQIAHDLAYRLYAICERKKWPDEALAYNALVASWPAIQEKAARIELGAEQQERGCCDRTALGARASGPSPSWNVGMDEAWGRIGR